MMTRLKNRSYMVIAAFFDIFIILLILYALCVQNYVEFGKTSERTITVEAGQSVMAAFQGNARRVTKISFRYRTKEKVSANITVKSADGDKEYCSKQVTLMGDDACTIKLNRLYQSKKEAYVMIQVLDNSKSDLELMLSEGAGCQLLYEGQWITDQFIFLKLHTSDYNRLAALLLIIGIAGNLLIFLIQKIKDEEKLGKILSIVYVVIIILLSLWNLQELYGPIGGDQPGYWGHALNFSGHNGKYMMPNWFAAGYSILLGVIMQLSSSSDTVYRIALILNVLLGTGMFLILKQLIKKLKPVKVPVSATIAFLVSCYSAYLFQRGIVWPETLVYFLFLCTILAFMYVAEDANMKNIFVLGTLSVYLYLVHNRTIIVLLAVMVSALLLFYKKRMSLKQFAGLSAVIIIGYIFGQILKDYTSILMWNEANAFKKNSISSVLEALFANGNVLLLFYSVCGKLWYLISATYGLAGIGIIFWLVSLYKMVRRNDIKIYVYLYIVLCFLGTMAVGVLSALPRTEPDAYGFRLDTLIYGRYLEAITGILVAGAGMYLYEIKDKILTTKVFGIVLLVYLFASGGIFIYLRQYKIQNLYVTVPCIPGVYFDSDFSFVKYSFIVLVIFTCIYIAKMVLMQNDERRNWKKITITSTILVCLFLETAYAGNIDYTINFSRGWKEYDELVEFCGRCSDTPIYLEQSIGDNVYWQIDMRAMDTKCLKYRVVSENKSGKARVKFLYEQPVNDGFILLRDMKKGYGTTAYEGYYYLGAFDHNSIGIYTKNVEIADRALAFAYDWVKEKRLVTCAEKLDVSVNEAVNDNSGAGGEVVDETGEKAGIVRQVIWNRAEDVENEKYSMFVQIEVNDHVVITDDCIYYLNGQRCDGSVGQDGILTITKDIVIDTGSLTGTHQIK